ncbi:MAG TPA: tetratricopeptide repeat protein [Longimicrobiales bacterium]
MARYDRIAPLPAPTRDRAFPAWLVLRDLEGRDRDVELARRVRLRFLALRPVRRLIRPGVDAVTAESFDRQIEGVREELGHLGARDPERVRLARFLHQIRKRTPLAVTTAALDMGEVIEAAGHPYGAEEFYRTALELADAHDLTPERVVAGRLLGRVYRKRAKWDEAVRAYRAASELALGLEGTEQWGRSMDGLAAAYREQGRTDDARRVYREMLTRGRERDDEPLTSMALIGLCLTEVEAGDYERAVEHGWAAFAHARDGEGRSAVLRGLGLAFAGVGLYRAAERCHQIVAERAADAETRVQALLDLARVAAHAGRPDVARERLREAVGAADRDASGALLGQADELLAELERGAAGEAVAGPAVRATGESTRRIAAEIEALGTALVPASG